MRGRRHKAKETVSKRRRFPSARAGSQSGGVRAFQSLLLRVDVSSRKQVCLGLADTLEETFDELSSAVRVRDIRTIDRLTENLKFLDGAERSCRIR